MANALGCSLFLLLLVFSQFAIGERPLNILGVTGVTKSHSFAVFPVLEALAARGHNVTFLHPDNDIARGWYPVERRPKGLNFVFEGNQIFGLKMPDMKLLGWVETLQFFGELAQILSSTMEKSAFPLDIPTEDIINNQPEESPIDVVVTSMISLGARRAANTLGVPVVSYVHAPILLEFLSNNHSHNLRFPSLASGVTQDQIKTQFGKRLWNQAAHLFMGTFFQHILVPTFTNIFKDRYNETNPFFHVSDIFVGVWAGNHHMVLGGAPFSPPLPKGFNPHLHVLGVVSKGGEGKVEGELGEWLDDAEETGAAVVYISMGTIYEFTEESIVPLLTNLDSLLSFQQQDQQEIWVLWSLRASQQQTLHSLLQPLISSHPRLRLESFTPQPHVLSHPSVKVFLSHCGWGGLSDTLKAGKPVLAFPTMGDQPSNAVGVVQGGAGERLSPNFADLSTLVFKILGEWDVYSQNVNRLYQELAAYGGLDHAVALVEGVGRGREVVQEEAQRERREMIDEFFFESQWEVRAVLYSLIFVAVGVAVGVFLGFFVCLPWKVLKFLIGCCCGGKRKVD